MNNIKKIKVVFVASSTNEGGAERVQINIMNSLPSNKYNIYFINSSYHPRPKTLNENIKYIKLNKPNTRKSFIDLLKIIRKFRPEYIFTTSIMFAYILVFIKIITFLRSKIYVRIAVPPSESKMTCFKGKILKQLNRFALKRADLIIAQTEFSKNDVIKHYNIHFSKIKVIRNIVDEMTLNNLGSKFIPVEFNNSNFNIVASGALYSVKGFDLLIEGISNIVMENKNVKLYILGKVRYELDYEELLKEMIEKFSLNKNVFLIGHKENPYPYYKNADLFVLSSRTEGFPNVVLESLFLGTPVIATDCVDFTNVINEGINGYVVKKNSALEIEQGVKNGMKNLKKPIKFNLENFNYQKLFK